MFFIKIKFKLSNLLTQKVSKLGSQKLGYKCIRFIDDKSGISAINMINNVYAVIMGKQSGENSYKTTTISYLDHYVAGNVNAHT